MTPMPRPAAVWAVAIAISIAGAMAATRLPLAARTTVEVPRLMVNATWNGASAEVVEMYVTAPLESAIHGVRGVRRTDSESRDNSMSITVELGEGTDIPIARLGILERIERLRAELPPGVSPVRVSNFAPEGLEELPLLQVDVSGPYTPGTLQQLLDDVVVPQLAAVEGVSSVRSMGGNTRGIAVTYDPATLRRVGVAPGQLVNALTTAGARVPLGTDAGQRSAVLTPDATSLNAVRALPVTMTADGMGAPLTVGDIATVRADEESDGRFFRIDGNPAVALFVDRASGADAMRTSAAVRAVLDAVQRKTLRGTTFRVRQDSSEDIAKTVADLARRGLVAVCAVVLLLWGATRAWRMTVAVIVSTIVAILATALTLYLLEIPANVLTLAGLGMGFGVLVQNAVVVASTVRAVVAPVLASTLTTAVVLLPFLYLQGDARAAFVPFAAAFLAALGWSVVTALVLVPVVLPAGLPTRHALRYTSRQTASRGVVRTSAHHIAPAFAKRMRRTLLRVGHGVLRYRAIALCMVLAAFAGTAWTFIAHVPRSSWGGFGEQRTTLSVSLSFPRGSDPETLNAAMRDFESLLRDRPEVEHVAVQGSLTSATLQALFSREGERSMAPLELEELLTQRALLVGGAAVSVRGSGPGFSGGSSAVSIVANRVRVLGYSYEGTGRLAEDLVQRLEQIPRVRNVTVTAGRGWGADRGAAISLLPDREAMRRAQVSARDVASAIAREVRGPVGRFTLDIDGEELPVTVKSTGARDRSVDELQDAMLPTPSGVPLRLADVVRTDERETPAVIAREDQQYVRQVNYDFRGPARLAQRTHAAFFDAITVPAGYVVEDAARVAATDDESSRGLWLVFAVGVLLVVITAAVVFDSAWGALLVLGSLPAALAGVALAFRVTGAAFGREAAVGVILVVGLAVNQAILVIDRAVRRRRARVALGLASRLSHGEVVRCVAERSGVVVLVGAVSLASLIPLAIGTSATTLFGAIALATVGGTVLGTVGALCVTPLLIPARRRVAGVPAVTASPRAA